MNLEICMKKECKDCKYKNECFREEQFYEEYLKYKEREKKDD